MSDATGTLTFEPVAPPALTTLSTDDAFLLDASKTAIPAVYVWIGKLASRLERRMSLQYAQNYVHQKVAAGEGIAASVSIVKVNEGEVSDAFVQAIERG